MKRWQDRGEVQDSEDEELSLRNDYQSPEQARKHQKCDGDDTVVEPNSLHADTGLIQYDHDGDDGVAPWLQPKLVATFAGTSISAKPTGTEPKFAPTVAGKDGPNLYGACSEEASDLTKGHAATGATHGRFSSQLDELPDVQQVTQQEPHEEGNDEHDRGDVSSALSSPLSVLEVPPGLYSPLSPREVSPRPAFRFPRPFNNIQADQVEAKRIPYDSDLDPLTSFDDEIPIFSSDNAGTGRHILRPRQEKQLHPFMYDKALYQQQCRQRGMRPVHFSFENRVAAETQDGSFSGGESDGQGETPPRASPPSPQSSPLIGQSVRGRTKPRRTEEHSDPDESEEDFVDLGAVLLGTAGGLQDARKRRKIVHLEYYGRRHQLEHPRSAQDSLESQSEGFSIPPSPPLTSRDSIQNPDTTPAIPSFRLPLGHTPAPLPTPQISSDVRPIDVRTVNDESDVDGSLRRHRTSAATRLSTNAMLIDSSTELSEDESDGVDLRRLHREQNRIKGVLPASWLKIDLQAQQRADAPPPSRRRKRRLSVTSPPKRLLQKGVAQRITSRGSATPRASEMIDVSDDGGSSDDPILPLPSHSREQRKLTFPPSISAVAATNTVDDEEMETDWIDPMLAGSVRQASKRSNGGKRQARLSKAFQQVQRERMEISKERSSVRFVRGADHSRKDVRFGRSRAQRKISQHLSIIDYLGPAHEMQVPLPPFIRLAHRQARRQPDLGRHSPSSKNIRLATKHDTDEANANFLAWRDGKIGRRAQYGDRSWEHQTNYNADMRNGGEALYQNGCRQVLGEIDGNRQQRLPSPLRRDVRLTALKRSNIPVVQRPLKRQTQLHAVVLPSRVSEQCDEREISATTLSSRSTDKRSIPRRRNVQARTPRFRDVQFETSEEVFDQANRTAAFERRMQCLTENLARRSGRAITLPLQLDRLLDETPGGPCWDDETAPLRKNSNMGQASNPKPKSTLTLHHRLRKRRTQHINAEARQYRQPSEPLPEMIDVAPSLYEVDEAAPPVLQGLGPFGTRYATDFDIQPLPIGTFFHESAFIGSGDFAASLDFAGRNLDVVTGRIRVHVNHEVLEWSAWTEDVAAGIARIPRAVSVVVHTLDAITGEAELAAHSAVVNSNVEHVLRSVVRYCSRCVAFLDPVDRTSCVQHLQRFVVDLTESAIEHVPAQPCGRDVQLRVLQYCLVVANQALKLAEYPSILLVASRQCRELVANTATTLARHICPARLGDLRSFYESNRHISKREEGIRDNDVAVSSIVILHHVSLSGASLPVSFWTVMDDAMPVSVKQLVSISALDRMWYDIFTFLPILEIDAFGIMRPGSRLYQTQEYWAVVKPLVERLFELYPATSTLHGSTVNDYVRATLTRCYLLISRWGWWRSEIILGCIFDFFARRGLAPLQHEENRRSPKYLEELEGHPSMEVRPEDTCFHIFLKMLALSLQGMGKHSLYSNKKIGGIAWRYIPNHGRTYRKDSYVKQTDIDALRNHHDLLCTLYYASPSEHRIGVEVLRSLVDHGNSHREACRLSVRSWTHLASFQAASFESVDRLQSLTLWLRDILQTTCVQFRLARDEAEQDFASAKARGNLEVPERLLLSTIASNQRQIAATLVDVLAGLTRALKAASSLQVAVCLIEGSMLWTIFEPFDATERRLFDAFVQSLVVVETALEIEQKYCTGLNSQQSTEDSQDFGDSSSLQMFAGAENGAQYPLTFIVDVLHDPIARLISNVFGADAVIDESMLTRVIDIWVKIAQANVRRRKVTWSRYLDKYSPVAWSCLRETEQTSKYEPYYLAQIVEVVACNESEVKKSILTSYLISLVEREALLKFQHTLTAALLNRWHDKALLQNLPFARDAGHSCFSISLRQLRQRRLSLISMLLSNMRADLADPLSLRPSDDQEKREYYNKTLQQLMQAMKRNYQGLQSDGDIHTADPSVQGAYVDFVQQVVSLLQQHASEICRVDPFFLNSAVFPLPANDPNYVVGKLRGYTTRLADSKTRKQLAVFIHSLSERAAIDSQQEYLVEQLFTATSGILELGSIEAPTLRYVLMTAIFPAFISCALSTACAWILAWPILQASARIARDLMYWMKFNDADSIDAAVSMMTTIIRNVECLLQQAVHNPGLIALPHVRKILSVSFGACQSCLAPLAHVYRTTGSGTNIIETLQRLYGTITQVGIQLSRPGDLSYSYELLTTLPYEDRWGETKAFAKQQVHAALQNDWLVYDGQYFVRRGHISREVSVRLSDCHEEGQSLVDSMESFRTTFMMLANPGRRRQELQSINDVCGVAGVLV